MGHDWPYLTADMPAIPAVIRRCYEDFRVEEVPAYEPCGTGDHVYFGIEKTGITTRHAAREVARVLRVAPRAIGFAGLKDARGIARQTLSVEGVDPARVRSLALPRVRVLWVRRHRHKLRTGHLRANRVTMKLRDSDPGRLDEVRAIVELLSRRGVPNYFGPQRFGRRGDTWQIGRALVRGDHGQAAALIAGAPGPRDSGAVLTARQHFAAGLYEKAASSWPPGFGDCARLCRALTRGDGDVQKAVSSLDRGLRGFYVSAYQSWLFNHVLAERICGLDRLEAGDVAYKHDNGAVFRVGDPRAEQPRADRFEISPTGPLFGRRMVRSGGEPGTMEQRTLRREGLSEADFCAVRLPKCSGARRPLRFRVEDGGARSGDDASGPFVELSVTLPAGCYATALLREICKDRLVVCGQTSSGE